MIIRTIGPQTPRVYNNNNNNNNNNDNNNNNNNNHNHKLREGRRIR